MRELDSDTAVGPANEARAVEARLRRLAGRWLGDGNAPGAFDDIRFDVACVTFRRAGDPEIEVIEGAF